MPANPPIHKRAKHFVWLFIAMAGSLLCGGEYLLRTYMANIKGTEAYRAANFYQPKSYNIAVGDSHIYNAFRFDQKGVNLGRPASNFREMNHIIRQFYKLHTDNLAQQKIIVQVSHRFLSPLARDRKILVTNSYELYWLAQYSYFFEPAIATRLYDLFKHFSFKNNLERLNNAANDDQRWVEKGGAWASEAEAMRYTRVKTLIEKDRPLWDERGHQVIQNYRQLIGHLHSKNINICMLRTPLANEYMETIANDEDFIRVEIAFKKIATEFNVNYLDFRDIPLNWQADNFVDATHLSALESERFSALAWDMCFPNTSAK